MIIRYTNSKYKEISILVNQQDLLQISDLFSMGEGYIICNSDSNPTPYEQYAVGLNIKPVKNKLVEFSINENKEILVEGDPTMLSVIAENIIDFSENTSTESHIHLDYFEEHPYLTENSIPIIIAFSCIDS
jgi:hypothetical protein